ncbi:flavodoxin family protein [Pseudochryseolinea flava]|uniref:Flavodoxin family protein n=1 Tax=Pseudochryseolinea flava TaxID=2059302 RepID=A0A364XUZ6_9BACT|nr:flavodoxin family protein [Pseudochryseolinea flava]RAV98152.1 hypothetical protein DQQ10_25130 [Pseudochryseolinea flava]
MKSLIVYYSFTRNNEKLAKYLQTQLQCDIAEIETVKSRNGFSIFLDLLFNRKPKIKPIHYWPLNYDHVIVIAPIWGGKIAMPMTSFLLNERSNIKQYSFITLCGGQRGQKEKINKYLTSLLHSAPRYMIELWINDLLPAAQKDSVKHTSQFRIEAEEVIKYHEQLKEFLVKERSYVAVV